MSISSYSTDPTEECGTVLLPMWLLARFRFDLTRWHLSRRASAKHYGAETALYLTQQIALRSGVLSY